MGKLVLRTYGALAAAPFLLLAALVLFTTLHPPGNVPENIGRMFEVVWTATLAASGVALTLTLFLFRRVAALFGPRGVARWPLYAALFALCVSSLLGTAFALVAFRTLLCPLD